MTLKCTKNIFLCVCMLFMHFLMYAQTGGCFFKDTLFRIDFGNDRAPQEFNLKSLKNYQRAYDDCPNDGFFSYSAKTSNCFNGDWITLSEDHTPGDSGGRMFFVNASYNASVFFIANLSGFKSNTTYEFGIWMMNLRKLRGGCIPIPPNIVISLETTDGKRLTAFQTGKISASDNPSWRKYFAQFTTPAGVTTLTLKMENINEGGCGNDFTMDDITFRECYKIEPRPLVKNSVQPKKEIPKVPNRLPANQPTAARVLKPEKIVVAKKTLPDQPAVKQVIRAKPVKVRVPDVMVSRENPVIKQIQTEAAEMLVQLYDNGQVDGDTVSIYQNNSLIVSRAGLSEKPISFTVQVDKNNPHHELVMVADNLGSIPPNTSLMIITANGKRYEVFISSSEQKNAKLLIDLKE